MNWLILFMFSLMPHLAVAADFDYTIDIATINESAPMELDFGNILYGDHFIKNVQLKNSGAKPIERLKLDIYGFEYFLEHECPNLLPPNASCAVQVLFWPEMPGLHRGFLIIETSGLNVNIPMKTLVL
tara:strand:- start:15627 stop:16010 length:384 start_codon:yes stop_codon:yes gene_type:complete